MNRFSEDLDFALKVPDRSFELGGYLRAVVEDLGAFGYQIEIDDLRGVDEVVKKAFLKDDCSSLDQTGPWAGQNLRVDGPWCAKTVRAKIGALDFSRVREDVRNFLKPVEQRSLGLWDRDFFAGVAGKVFES